MEDLDGLREKSRGEGVWIDPNREDYDYGRFAWIMDPERDRIELGTAEALVTDAEVLKN